MEEQTPIISNELLSLLICPVSGAVLDLDESGKCLINEKLGVSYKIEDGVPVLVQESDIEEQL